MKRLALASVIAVFTTTAFGCATNAPPKSVVSMDRLYVACAPNSYLNIRLAPLEADYRGAPMPELEPAQQDKKGRWLCTSTRESLKNRVLP